MRPFRIGFPPIVPALGLGVAALALSGCTDRAREQIRIVGSSTVFPFTTAVAESFTREHPEFRAPIVESLGTGGGLKLFCAGVGSRHPDVANASRRITPLELGTCLANGVREVVEVQIGIDGLVLVQGRRGEPLNLTLRDVYLALAAEPWGERQTARTWKDVNPALPAVRIEVLGPPPTSGTRDAFNELYMQAGCLTNPAMADLKATDNARFRQICEGIREDGAYIDAGENDNLLVQQLVQNPYAVAAFGFSYFEANTDRLRGVPVNGVAPTYEDIANFRYPGARPMFIYVKGEHVRAIRGLADFLDEYTSEGAWGPRGYLVRRGLIASPADVRKRYRERALALLPLTPEELDGGSQT
ncbi:substrate-binding domain-containing protein [Thermaurantiacus sp.]